MMSPFANFTPDADTSRIGTINPGGDYLLHYRNDQKIKAGFSGYGFTDIKVHNPASYYDSLPLKKLEIPGTVRIVKATV